jgi:sugar lactone lactonase YvrE
MSIDNSVGTVTGTSVSVKPSATTTYTLTATNAAGTTATAQVTVTVVAAPVIASFTTASSTITAGGSTTLSWSVTGATSLSIDNSVGAVTGTSVSVSPTATTTYTLTATNAAGTTVTAQVTVTVVAAPSITNFTASPSLLNPVTVGTTTSTLSWSVANATTVSIDNSIGTETGTSISVTPSATKTYTLTATNAAGTSVTGRATVGVRNNLAVLAGLEVLAGAMYPGSDIDGTGTAATFNYPTGIAVGGSGNLYIADTDNNEIRKVTSAGVVTTIASGAALTSTSTVRSHASHTLEGNAASSSLAMQARMRRLSSGVRATPESSNSLIKNAGLNDPEGIAVTSDGGTIYVADTGNEVIRRIVIASDGTATMSTFAGTAGTSGSADGTGTAASFFSPTGIALDASGNVYVADSGNSEIRKITSAGVVTTLTGTDETTGLPARFVVPEGVTVDASGNVYVAETFINTILKITSAGVVTTLAGSDSSGSTDGTGTAATFTDPVGIAADASGNVYVADSGNSEIRKITSAGVVTTLAGKAGTLGSTDGAGTAASFTSPEGVAVDTSGNVYVADSGDNKIRMVTSAGVVTSLAGDGDYTTSGSADGTGTAALFDEPEGIAVDASGNLYVADMVNDTIRKITSEGVVTTFAGTAGIGGSVDGTGTAALFYGPEGIAVDASGNVYVADTYNSTIRKITSEGVVTTFAGTAGTHGSTDGAGAAASFYQPEGIAVDASNNLYVADTYNCAIRMITSAGVVTTLAGKAGTCGYTDGTGTAARFFDPQGIAVDTSGNIYVADTGNSTIRKITSTGVVTTFAGTAGTAGYADGTGTAALFYDPEGIAVDASGNVYVADMGNNVIRKITPAGIVTTVIGVYGAPEASTGLLPASIYSPLAIAADSTGNLYITVPNAVLTLEP